MPRPLFKAISKVSGVPHVGSESTMIIYHFGEELQKLKLELLATSSLVNRYHTVNI